jgi:hypothetical protein
MLIFDNLLVQSMMCYTAILYYEVLTFFTTHKSEDDSNTKENKHLRIEAGCHEMDHMVITFIIV